MHSVPFSMDLTAGVCKCRRKPISERKVAVLVYGFPPGVGATGTAALLNVPKSLEHLMKGLKVGTVLAGGCSAKERN